MNLKEIDYNRLFEGAVTTVRVTMTGLEKTKFLDFLAPLALRVYLAPIFWMAGSKKFAAFGNTADWFGNDDWGLGLPMPYLLVFLVAFIEVLGGVCLLLGLGVRLMSIPLMIVVGVAGVIVHLQNGWLAIATGKGLFATERTIGAVDRLEQAKSILQQFGNYDWLTENGNFVVLNNGIEFAATYFIMLLTLFFIGSGRYVSVDYWLSRKYRQGSVPTS